MIYVIHFYFIIAFISQIMLGVGGIAFMWDIIWQSGHVIENCEIDFALPKTAKTRRETHSRLRRAILNEVVVLF